MQIFTEAFILFLIIFRLLLPQKILRHFIDPSLLFLIGPWQPWAWNFALLPRSILTYNCLNYWGIEIIVQRQIHDCTVAVTFVLPLHFLSFKNFLPINYDECQKSFWVSPRLSVWNPPPGLVPIRIGLRPNKIRHSKPPIHTLWLWWLCSAFPHYPYFSLPVSGSTLSHLVTHFVCQIISV